MIQGRLNSGFLKDILLYYRCFRGEQILIRFIQVIDFNQMMEFENYISPPIFLWTEVK